jgi:hypothetical protein
MSKSKTKLKVVDDGDSRPPDSAWARTGMFVNVADAVKLLHCSRSTFFTRLRNEVYREARIRVGDEPFTEKVFRAPELLRDEERRCRACELRGEKAGWERSESWR